MATDTYVHLLLLVSVCCLLLLVCVVQGFQTACALLVALFDSVEQKLQKQ